MLQNQANWLNTLKPNFKILSLKDRLICAVGALLGLGLSSLISWIALNGFNAWYIAPMGASAVLLFAVAASPLAQPWNVVVGNTIAGVIGVSCALWIPNLTIAFSVAVALSIFLMMTTDSLHPPSGAVAITAVLGGGEVHNLGYAFVLYPVLLNSILLLIIAVIFNRFMGKQYPQKAQINTRSADPTALQKVSVQPKDIQQVLAKQTELIDISEYDLQHIILEAQYLADARKPETYTCGDIMTKDVICLYENDEVKDVLAKFKQINLMSLPVVNTQNILIGTLALYDVMECFNREPDMKFAWGNQVQDIMSKKVITVKPDQSIQTLIPYFVEHSFNYIPVVENKKLIGIISRADMIAVLNQQLRESGK